jgi:hypothetical protein
MNQKLSECDACEQEEKSLPITRCHTCGKKDNKVELKTKPLIIKDGFADGGVLEVKPQEPSTSDADIKPCPFCKDAKGGYCQACLTTVPLGGYKTDADIIKEFRDKFVTPIDSELRAMNLNNEPCVMGKAKDVEEFILEAIKKSFDTGIKQAEAEQKLLEEITKRENDISAWRNYGEAKGYFSFFEGKIREEVKQELREKIKNNLK